ncbi:hypothetical protein [Pseudorhodobacter sp. MZDSW-24AT]|uniref:hypothetical protein n=1 Tax=Pseudorhodobacter sp. MZDSW-24AT TaxID=2052957 RepID=UPI000C1F76AB|nr:hypothetical protein [Pseudorhodobacter sp. MZDSW-24AT]PJF10792.1 hypothetical protein CUR21_02215 [Pseudorhodobacter sp. MZDSW-24AT]
MKDALIIILLATNAVTGFAFYELEKKTSEEILTLKSTSTTSAERDIYGNSCVKWLAEEGAKEGTRTGEFYLGRSWRKHGQLVFEVISPQDDIGKARGDALCTYDIQSGMMYSYTGSSRSTWLFY